MNEATFYFSFLNSSIESDDGSCLSQAVEHTYITLVGSLHLVPEPFPECFLLLFEPPKFVLDGARLLLLGLAAGHDDLQQGAHRPLLLPHLLQPPPHPLPRLPHCTSPCSRLALHPCTLLAVLLQHNAPNCVPDLRSQRGLLGDEVVLALAAAVTAEQSLSGVVVRTEAREEEKAVSEGHQGVGVAVVGVLEGSREVVDCALKLSSPHCPQLFLFHAFRLQLGQPRPPTAGRSRHFFLQCAHFPLQLLLLSHQLIHRALARAQRTLQPFFPVPLAFNSLLQFKIFCLKRGVGDLQSCDLVGLAGGQFGVVLLNSFEVSGQACGVLKHGLELLTGQQRGHGLSVVFLSLQFHMPGPGCVLLVVEGRSLGAR